MICISIIVIYYSLFVYKFIFKSITHKRTMITVPITFGIVLTIMNNFRLGDDSPFDHSFIFELFSITENQTDYYPCKQQCGKSK